MFCSFLEEEGFRWGKCGEGGWFGMFKVNEEVSVVRGEGVRFEVVWGYVSYKKDFGEVKEEV